MEERPSTRVFQRRGLLCPALRFLTLVSDAKNCTNQIGLTIILVVVNECAAGIQCLEVDFRLCCWVIGISKSPHADYFVSGLDQDGQLLKIVPGYVDIYPVNSIKSQIKVRVLEEMPQPPRICAGKVFGI